MSEHAGEEGPPLSIYKWGDNAGLNTFEVRPQSSGKFLVIAGHGPVNTRTYVSILLGPEAILGLHSALDEVLTNGGSDVRSEGAQR